MLSSPRLLLSLLAACSILWSACAGGGGLLGKEFEYEEELRLYVDGSARMDLSSSVAALVALRGFELDSDPAVEIDRTKIRELFAGPGVDVRSVRVSRRDGRRFVHVRIDVGGTIVTASITNESVDELGLKKGMAASAVIKSSDVMVAVD